MNFEDLNVVVMAYARPEHFKKVLDACARSLEKVKVYVDFPADEGVQRQQQEIDKIIDQSPLECEVYRRPERFGLVKSILTAVEEQLRESDHIILLEDDCVPREGFFTFMKESLEKYKDNPDITTICGTRTKGRFNPWGWATWRHKWNYGELSVDEMLKIQNLDEELYEFLSHNSVDKMIWSLSWIALQHKNDCYSHYPRANLIKNIGLDHSGVHSHEEGFTQWLYSQIMENLKE